MIPKINVTENIGIQVQPEKIEVLTRLDFVIAVNFTKRETQPTLDENGDLFEPVYKLFIKAERKYDNDYTNLSQIKEDIKNLSELKKFIEFVYDNKENLFKMAGFKGALG